MPFPLFFSSRNAIFSNSHSWISLGSKNSDCLSEQINRKPKRIRAYWKRKQERIAFWNVESFDAKGHELIHEMDELEIDVCVLYTDAKKKTKRNNIIWRLFPIYYISCPALLACLVSLNEVNVMKSVIYIFVFEGKIKTWLFAYTTSTGFSESRRLFHNFPDFNKFIY